MSSDLTPPIPATATIPEPDITFDGAPAEAPKAPAEAPRDPNFTQQFPYTSEGFEHFTRDEPVAFLPGAPAATTRQVLTDMPNLKLGRDANSLEWMQGINAGLESMPFGEGLAGLAANEQAKFTQAVESPEGPLFGFAPKFKVREGQKPTGESARFHIRAAMNMGTVFAVPLWHSGFWITVKSPGESALLDLYEQLTQDKISLGRSTYGFLYSNGTSYATKVMFDFILEHVYDSSLSVGDGDDIRKHIRMPDLQSIIWGMACATWPNGFQYQRSCVSDPEKCRHVVHEKLNLTKLLWTDTTALTDYQRKQMTKRQRGSVTVAEVTRYVDEFVRGQSRMVKINDKLSMILRVPTVLDHIDAGYRWVNTIEELYPRVLGKSEQERDDYLVKQGKASMMRQYGHFVKSISVGEGAEPTLYEELSEIEETLDDLTENDQVRTVFFDRIKEFLDVSIISLVAIPTFVCPVCGNDQASEGHKKHPELIALDVMQTFFQLLMQKLRKIEAR